MSHNFIIIILILGLIIGMFIKILNSSSQNNMLSSIKNVFQSPVEVKYLTYNPNFSLKEEINSLFIKFIILINEKNITNIQQCLWINKNLKIKILDNLDVIKVMPIREVSNIRILENQSEYVKAEIISKHLENENYKILDIFVFEKINDNYRNLILKHIDVKEYTLNFPDALDYIKMEK